MIESNNVLLRSNAHNPNPWKSRWGKLLPLRLLLEYPAGSGPSSSGNRLQSWKNGQTMSYVQLTSSFDSKMSEFERCTSLSGIGCRLIDGAECRAYFQKSIFQAGRLLNLKVDDFVLRRPERVGSIGARYDVDDASVVAALSAVLRHRDRPESEHVSNEVLGCQIWSLVRSVHG